MTVEIKRARKIKINGIDRLTISMGKGYSSWVLEKRIWKDKGQWLLMKNFLWR